MSELSKRILKETEADFGEGVMINGNDLLKEKKKVIPLTPTLDTILGGGIPEGCWATFTGAPKIGKSTLAIQYARNWLNSGPKREVYYGNVEKRLKKMNLNACKGLDLERFHIIQSTKTKIMAAEDFLRKFESILRTQEQVLLIVDSFAMLSEQKEQNEGIGTMTRGGGARLLSQFCRDIAQVFPVMDSTIVGITHIIANTSGYGSHKMEKGGNAIWYQADVKLAAIKEEEWRIGNEETGKIIGKKVKWHCEASALGAPYGEAVSFNRFGEGIDEVVEITQLGVELGFIKRKGSYYYFSFLTETDPPKVQGADALHAAFTENKDWFSKLYKEVQVALGVIDESPGT